MPSRLDAGWLRYTTASFLTRFPQPMGLLVLQLVGVRLTGRLADGAMLVGLTSLCGIVGPSLGRWFDRGDAKQRLQTTAVLLAGSLAGIALSVQMAAPFWVVVCLTVIQGACLAGAWTGFRSLMAAVVSGAHREQAHYVESLMVEVGYAVGPLAAGGVILLWGVPAAVWTMAAAELAGVVLLARLPISAWSGPRSVHPSQVCDTPRDRISRLRLARLLAVPLAVAGVSSFGFSMIESNVPSRMPGIGLPESSAGLFMAMLATGSCVGGLVVSLVPGLRRKAFSRPDLLFALFALCDLPAAMAGSAWLYALALPINSLPLVSLSGFSVAGVESRVGTEARGEGFGMVNASTRLAGGVGTITGGLLLGVLAPARIPLVAFAAFLVTAAALRLARNPGRSEPGSYNQPDRTPASAGSVGSKPAGA